MDGRFYHVFLRPASGIAAGDIKAMLKPNKDWMNYGDNCWIIFTATDPARLAARLKRLARDDGNFLLAPILLTQTDGMPATFSDWVKRAKGKKRVTKNAR